MLPAKKEKDKQRDMLERMEGPDWPRVLGFFRSVDRLVPFLSGGILEEKTTLSPLFSDDAL